MNQKFDGMCCVLDVFHLKLSSNSSPEDSLPG